MRFRILLFLILCSLSALSQHNHYIYIQSDNQQNFYIRKGSEIISSSASGYVILPKIGPGQQEFLVGFPKNQFPEYQFAIDIKGKDRGFALKNFNEKGWGLFDLQTLEVIMGKKVEPKKEEVKKDTGPLADDPFSVILASAVGDQRIRETSLVYREEIVVQAPPPAKAESVKQRTSEIPKSGAAVAKTAVPAKGDDVAKEPAPLSQKDSSVAAGPASPVNDANLKNTAAPAKKEEAVKHTDDPAGNTAVAKAAADSAQRDAVVRQAGGPADKAEVVTQSAGLEKPAPETSAEIVKSDAGNKPKKRLNVKNPFARKTPSPVKAEPGVVMIAGAPERDKAGEKKDSVTASQGDMAVAEPQNNNTSKDPVTVSPQEPAVKNVSVDKYMEYKSGRETVLVFIDHQGAHDDTIRISIDEDIAVVRDNKKEAVPDSVPGPVVNVEKPAAAGVAGNVVPGVKEDKPMVDNLPGAVKEKSPVKEDQQVEEKRADPAVAGVTAEVRTDCRRMASEKDMVAMRKKMIMITDEDEMIAIALKDFKSRCYSTERIQNLSYVFTTDKGRYKLFDAAFPYVYDPSNFPQLERLLNDEYYINRFRALVNKN